MRQLINRMVLLFIIFSCVLSTSACKCTHDYKSEITVAPTCCSNGIRTFVCSVCKDSYVEDIIATGNHMFTEPTITKEASCKEAGVESYTCIISGKEYTREIEKTDDHDYDYKILKAATSTVYGQKKYTCSICNDSYIETFLLSKVKCSTSRIRLRMSDYSVVYCWVVSVSISQDNAITGITIGFSFEDDIVAKWAGFGNVRICLNGVRRSILPLGVVSCRPGVVTEAYSLIQPISLTEGEVYTISLEEY